MGSLATQEDTTIVAGVVEDFGTDQFKNAAVAWDRSGKIVDRYDKVHRVPFGEYVPARGFVSHFGDFSPVPRDAAPGHGDGVLLTRAGRARRDDLLRGLLSRTRPDRDPRPAANCLLVPTNASSFKGRQVPAQEIAAAQLRAVETGRDLIQAAPTGYSAFVDARGRVTHRSRLGAAATATTTLHRRSGLTPFDRLGDRPMIGFIVFVLVAAAVLDRIGQDQQSSLSAPCRHPCGLHS